MLDDTTSDWDADGNDIPDSIQREPAEGETTITFDMEEDARVPSDTDDVAPNKVKTRRDIDEGWIEQVGG